MNIHPPPPISVLATALVKSTQNTNIGLFNLCNSSRLRIVALVKSDWDIGCQVKCNFVTEKPL